MIPIHELLSRIRTTAGERFGFEALEEDGPVPFQEIGHESPGAARRSEGGRAKADEKKLAQLKAARKSRSQPPPG